MTTSWNIVVRAASLAAKLHDGQVRKDGTPYFQHPARVATILARAGADDELVAAGFLHDVIEDTPADYDDVSDLLGTDVADWVAVMSKDHRMPEPTREPAYKKQLVKGPWQGRAIKLADQIDNFTASMVNQNKAGKRRLLAARWAIEIAADDDHDVIRTLRSQLVDIVDSATSKC
ncbi:MAG: metal-dependent phosphohydrolase [Phycisphaerae bacterium]|nr:metal-dependent phosphohydrolase [Phycisphaerae bacterium]|tara:strand:- start:481 stop:1005 length:525 start_codon:yes stop_codon:yes gene_type:complete